VESVAKRKPINAIFMDINMPKENGKDAAKKIREFEGEKNLSSVTLIMISANCIKSEIDECLDQNGSIRALQFMKKPVTLDQLKKLNLRS
jgi:CheY-like chemotaxis protein